METHGPAAEGNCYDDRQMPEMMQCMPDSVAPGAGAQRPPGPGGAVKPQRILVLGAGGFIGQRVVQALALCPWAAPVAAVHRHRAALPAAVETVHLDARQPDSLRAALENVGGVVNCVTGDGETIRQSAHALFSACAAPHAPRVVHLSSMMVYGTQTGTLDESAPLLGDWDDYSRAKAHAEAIARACTRVVHLRPGIVYGPHSPIWSGWVGQWLMDQRLGDLGTHGQGRCNLVHIDDVVAATLQALRAPGIEGQAFNLALPDAPTWNEYFRGYADALGIACVPISGARLAIERLVLAPPFKVLQVMAARLRPGWRAPQPIRPWLLRLCAHSVRLDVRKAERVLGLQWTPLEAGLRQSAAWVLAGAPARAAAAAGK